MESLWVECVPLRRGVGGAYVHCVLMPAVVVVVVVVVEPRAQSGARQEGPAPSRSVLRALRETTRVLETLTCFNIAGNVFIIHTYVHSWPCPHAFVCCFCFCS